MIISHKHKFIFIKTEKTAGTSIEIALSKICGPDDVITPISKEDEKYRAELGYPSPQNFRFPVSSYGLKEVLALPRSKKTRKRTLGFYNHMSASAIKKHVDSQVWNSYFKFCFERNPFDKFISWYYWMNKESQYPDIKSFIESGLAKKVQGRNLYTIDNEVVVDKIYKFEDIPGALADLEDRLGLNGQLEMPSRKTKGGVRKEKRHYREVLDEEEQVWITNTFQKEINLMNYEF